MAGCITRCASIVSTTYSGVWWAAREHYGPNPLAMSSDYMLDLYTEDLEEYYDWFYDWYATYGGVVDNAAQFAKWLNWRLAIGTAKLGNLPQRKKDHEGISCAPCPYDTQADDVRSELMLGEVPSKADHGIYYMRVAQRGTSWGFECTYSGCSYLLDNGIPYFYA